MGMSVADLQSGESSADQARPAAGNLGMASGLGMTYGMSVAGLQTGKWYVKEIGASTEAVGARGPGQGQLTSSCPPVPTGGPDRVRAVTWDVRVARRSACGNPCIRFTCACSVGLPAAVPGCSFAPGRDMLCVLASPLRWTRWAGVCNLVTCLQDPFGSLFIPIVGIVAIFFLFTREITRFVQFIVLAVAIAVVFYTPSIVQVLATGIANALGVH